ncbi:nuclear transport factor 2 family protein [Halorubellus sp. PRR65]|uniref:nuclear transport factor 2 family protein n=1 Tax=Halorubellus sp. PRR65 TaxID=3098148 RepID=UPI002B261D89|nr:nuclear transport factor 2 family protein [Halorubellus sp. PRR65]
MSAEDAILDYYEALRRGEPLYPYFRESPATHKVAVSTSYDGYDAVAEALREQTRTTTDWTVDSDAPSVVRREDWASFHDDVSLAWTRTPADDDDASTRHEFETRWSGTLVEHDGEWLFLELHVSAPTAV